MAINPHLNSSVSSSTASTFNSKRFYPPSVPLSVYREVVQELRDTQARVETLDSKNQQLFEENKRLRKQLKEVINILEPTREREIISSDKELRKSSSSLTQSESWRDNYPSSFPEPQSYRIDVPAEGENSALDSDGIINGWVLGIIIFVIIVTSCTTAFLIVNSKLILNNNR
ncbi:hypothetical protein PCC7424_5021 [Gloeothece citriformis PCC 7424]|uniref:Uncharacterized protein n=1 Tax=Gloeothece citriformis (strain PCC 7424) TaxID=65393 RepID=B7KFP9_GLOC7|nr:hypothetical protein [Gloeothece citriformis]ACK73374.1 hypothetical protein PCC7424_5021 [Gloeothece citriformis PCC 7424]